MANTMDSVKPLRDMASELRKVAALLNKQGQSYEELDSNKIRDFLIFFGGSKNGK